MLQQQPNEKYQLIFLIWTSGLTKGTKIVRLKIWKENFIKNTNFLSTKLYFLLFERYSLGNFHDEPRSPLKS